MAMMYPWVLALVAGIALVLAIATVLLTRRPQPHAGKPLAYPERIRGLASFQALAKRLLVLGAVEILGVLLALGGAALVVARVIDTTPNAEERSNRDVLLCLDVSGSMIDVDKAMIDVYLQLAEKLEGERIGLVLFDASAVTVFPLTDDARYVQEQLAHAREEVSGQRIVGTDLADGSSLIGDGLASCVQRFDQHDVRRSRTVVFATDNQLSGDPLYSLEQATDMAVQREVMIFGVTPFNNEPTPTVALKRQVDRTHGKVMQLDTRGSTDVETIQEAVERQERVAMAARSSRVIRDLTWPGATLGLAGLLIAAGARLRRRW